LYDGYVETTKNININISDYGMFGEFHVPNWFKLEHYGLHEPVSITRNDVRHVVLIENESEFRGTATCF